jgi:DNA-nicking Smr family endonuclease
MTSNNDDRRAFTEAMRGVKPLKHDERAARTARPNVRARRGRASACLTTQSSADMPAYERGDEIAFRRPGLSARVFRRLRRGPFRSEEEIDLHGLTSDEAQGALGKFIAESIERGLARVRVVHGKGKGSGPGGPVLKNLVHRWLAEQNDVLAFVTADARHGGSGAVFVLLRQR